MKITTLLLFAAFMQVSASTLAQKVTLSDKNAPLTLIFDQISAQTGFDFAYTGTILRNAKPVTINVKNEELTDVLKEIFDGQPLEYTIEDKSVVVSLKQPILLDKVKAYFVTIEVHGHVVGEDGQPLVGATVIVKGTSISSITDSKGDFTLTNVDKGAILVISFVGYEKQEVTAQADLESIHLKQATSQLDAVQVIAYGQTSKRLNTGDISSVSSKEIAQQPVNNPLLALEGRVPGLFITQSTGFPGSAVSVTVQGPNSILNGNDPFYVVDGVPYTSQLLPNLGTLQGYSYATSGNPLSYINSSDIESISVLKDADATAIYGSRAANGAILITTKKGKAGETNVDVSLQNGWGSVGHFLNLMNTGQYLQMRHEAKKNDNAAVGPADYDINGFWDTTRNTDWQKKLMGGTAKYIDYNASVSGGSANTQYLIGATYHRETTVFPGDFSDQKGSVHFNINSVSTNQKFHIQLSGNYLIDNNQLPVSDLTTTAVFLAPDSPPLRNLDGSINWAPNSSSASTWSNPLAGLYNRYSNKATNLISNATVSYQLLPNLDIKSSFGYTNLQTNELAAEPLTSTAPESRPFTLRGAQYGNNNINSWIIEPQLNYKLVAGEGKLDVLLGTTIQQNNSRGVLTGGSGYNSDLVLPDIASASSLYVISTTDATYKYNALFGRINYNWNDKYLINLTARRDGSSRFGAANEFHDFGAVGMGWIFSKESFIQNTLPFLSYGKLRASYGSTGNDQIGDYQYLSQYSPISVGVPYQGAVGIQPNGLSNPHLQWELTKKLEFGLELGLLKDRVLLYSDYFRNRSSNELIGYALPIVTGFNLITENFPATVQNSGFEFSLNTTNIKSAKFSWTSSINLTIPQNKLLSFPNIANSNYANILVVGQSIKVAKAFKYLGVNPATGVYQFADSHGNSTSTPDGTTDNIVLVNTSPKFYGGFQNTIRYKGFELSALFQFVKEIGQNHKFGILLPGRRNVNQPISVIDRWKNPGDIVPIQRYSTRFTYATQYIDAVQSDAAWTDASYIRLKNLSITWQLPATLLQKTHLKNGSIFVLGQNLLTFTRYDGLDPETLSYQVLPPLKLVTFGLKVGL